MTGYEARSDYRILVELRTNTGINKYSNYLTVNAPVVDVPSLTSPSDKSIFNRNTNSSVTIRWTTASNADEYWLNVFRSGNSSNPEYNQSVGNVTSKTINISGYENGIYIFQVRARASGGTWGAYSGDRQFIADVPPDAPASSSPASGSTFTQGTSQTFSWSTPPAPNNNVERYYLRIVKGSDLNGTPVYHEELSGSTTSKSIAFVSGTYSTGNYVWGVRAIKSAPSGYNQTTYENAIGWGSYRTKNFAISDTQSGYGSISGTISTSISSGLVAVENVKVELRKNNSSVFQTYTSSDGSYSFRNVPSGVYEILISKNSYLTGKISYVNVSANKTVSNVDYSVFMPENVFSILQTDTDFIQSSYPNLFNKAKSLLDKFSTKLPSGLLEEEAEVLKRYDLALRFSKNAYTNGELFAYWSGETIGDLVTTALKMIIFDIAVQKWAEDKNFGRYLGERIIDPIKVKMANKLGEYSNKLTHTVLPLLSNDAAQRVLDELLKNISLDYLQEEYSKKYDFEAFIDNKFRKPFYDLYMFSTEIYILQAINTTELVLSEPQIDHFETSLSEAMKNYGNKYTEMTNYANTINTLYVEALHSFAAEFRDLLTDFNDGLGDLALSSGVSYQKIFGVSLKLSAAFSLATKAVANFIINGSAVEQLAVTLPGIMRVGISSVLPENNNSFNSSLLKSHFNITSKENSFKGTYFNSSIFQNSEYMLLLHEIKNFLNENKIDSVHNVMRFLPETDKTYSNNIYIQDTQLLANYYYLRENYETFKGRYDSFSSLINDLTINQINFYIKIGEYFINPDGLKSDSVIYEINNIEDVNRQLSFLQDSLANEYNSSINYDSPVVLITDFSVSSELYGFTNFDISVKVYNSGINIANNININLRIDPKYQVIINNNEAQKVSELHPGESKDIFWDCQNNGWNEAVPFELSIQADTEANYLAAPKELYYISLRQPVVGDCNFDGNINCLDLKVINDVFGATPVSGKWNVYCDIGPYIGIFPNIIPVPDQKIDSSDVKTYIDIWGYLNRPKNIQLTTIQNLVILSWNSGNPDIQKYKVYGSSDSLFVKDKKIKEISHPTSVIVDTLSTNDVSYYYKVTAVDSIGIESKSSKTVKVSATTVISNSSEILNSYVLNQNYPNPFNPITKISFSLAHPGYISLKVYNILGKELEVLIDEYKDSGQYTINFDASALPSGIYFYRLSTENFVEQKKMVLIR